jgi:anti-sigma factor RsiW
VVVLVRCEVERQVGVLELRAAGGLVKAGRIAGLVAAGMIAGWLARCEAQRRLDRLRRRARVRVRKVLR